MCSLQTRYVALSSHRIECVKSCNLGEDLCRIDLIICLGGDGTLLHVSSIFQKSCPPVLSFSMGSLGFLTPFDFKLHDKILNEVFKGNVPVLLRTRLSARIIRDDDLGFSSISNDSTSDSNENDKAKTNNDDTDGVYLTLNEIVIDRGPNSYLSNLDLYINDRFITKVQGDGEYRALLIFGMSTGVSVLFSLLGLIISTPTGSTAYAMAGM